MVERQSRTVGDAAPANGSPAPAAPRRVHRLRRLPAGRAVVGALLVTLAAVGVFAAHLQATVAPTSRYLVAGGTIAPGTTFGSVDEVRGALTSAPLDLVPELAARAVEVGQLETLVDRVVLSPLQFGDLVTRSAFAPKGAVADEWTFSFPVPTSNAVAGALRPGERIDVAATHESAGERHTAFVVRDVSLLAVQGDDGEAIGGSDELALTVALGSPDEVLALGHAVNTASIFVARASATSGRGDDPVPVHRGGAPALSGTEDTILLPGSGR